MWVERRRFYLHYQRFMGFPEASKSMLTRNFNLCYLERENLPGVYKWWREDRRCDWESDLAGWASVGLPLNAQTFLPMAVVYNGTIFAIRSDLCLIEAPPGFYLPMHTSFGGSLMHATWHLQSAFAGIWWRCSALCCWNFPCEVSS